MGTDTVVEPADLLLPESARPQRLAEAGTRLVGICPADQLPRLSAQFLQVAPLHVELAFGRDDQGRVRIEGHLTGRVSALCQRCLREVEIPLEGDFEYLPGEDSEDLLAPARPGPEAVDAPLALRTLAEDEALLLCPMIPRHPEGACEPAAAGAEPPAIPRDNPFDVLASLRHNSKDNSRGDASGGHSEE